MTAKPITWTCPGAVYDLALNGAAHLPAPMKATVWGQHGARYTYELDVAEAHAIWTRLMEVGSDPALVTDDLLAAAGRLDMAIMDAQRRSGDDDGNANPMAVRDEHGQAGSDAAWDHARRYLHLTGDERAAAAAAFVLGAWEQFEGFVAGEEDEAYEADNASLGEGD